MVGERRNSLPAQGFRELLDALARAAIDNAALALMTSDRCFYLQRGIGLAPHREMDVRPVEGPDENARLGGKQLPDDVRAGWRVGGGRHRDELKIADRLRRLREAEVFGPEIVPPLRDAMGLVDGEDIGSRLAKKGGRIRTSEALRRDVEEAISPPPQARLDCRIVFAAVRRVQRGGGNSAGLQLLHLIAHQSHPLGKHAITQPRVTAGYKNCPRRAAPMAAITRWSTGARRVLPDCFLIRVFARLAVSTAIALAFLA